MLGTTSPELEALMNDIMQEIAESEEGNFEDRFANDNEEDDMNNAEVPAEFVYTKLPFWGNPLETFVP